MEVAKDLILEATGALLTGARQVDTAGVTAEAFLVVDVVVVDTRRLCLSASVVEGGRRFNGHRGNGAVADLGARIATAPRFR